MLTGRLRSSLRAGRIVCGKIFLAERLVVAGLGEGAALAENRSIAPYLAVVVDALAAGLAGDTGRLVARHLARMDWHTDPLFAEEVCVKHLAVGEHLLLIFLFDMGEQFASTLLGGLKCGDANRLVGRGFAAGRQRRGEIDEGSRHLSPVAELDGALAQPAAGNDGDGVGRAAVDLDKRDQTLSVPPLGIIDSETLTSEHGHADAENLPGAEVAVGDFGFVEESLKGLHELMILLTSVFHAAIQLTNPSPGGNIRGPEVPMSELATTIGTLLRQKPSQVWSTEPDVSVYRSIELMAEKKVGALLVMEQGKLLGIISERDYARKVILLGKSSKDTCVAEIMSSPAIVVSLQHTVRDCMHVITDNRIRHLPVVDGGAVIGVVSIGDLVNWVISEQEKTIRHLEAYISGAAN